MSVQGSKMSEWVKFVLKPPPSVEKVMQFDVVRRVGTEMSGIPLDPADVERECENLSDDEEGVEVETENSVVVID